MSVAFAYVLVYATPVTSAQQWEQGLLTNHDCRSPRMLNGDLCKVLHKFHPHPYTT